jgi:hypothetical protein
MNIFSYIPTGTAPPSLAVNVEDDGVISFSIRGVEKIDSQLAPSGTIRVPMEQLLEMITAIARYLQLLAHSGP